MAVGSVTTAVAGSVITAVAGIAMLAAAAATGMIGTIVGTGTGTGTIAETGIGVGTGTSAGIAIGAGTIAVGITTVTDVTATVIMSATDAIADDHDHLIGEGGEWLITLTLGRLALRGRIGVRAVGAACCAVPPVNDHVCRCV